MLLLLIVLPALVAGMIYVAIALRLADRDRRNQGFCAGCGYDLSGLSVGVACPECGLDTDRNAADRGTFDQVVLAWGLTLCLLALPLLLPLCARITAVAVEQLFGLDLYDTLGGGYFVELTWLLGYGTLVLAHCLLIELCVRRVYPRRSALSVLARAIPVAVASAFVCWIALMLTLLPLMLD